MYPFYATENVSTDEKMLRKSGIKPFLRSIGLQYYCKLVLDQTH